MILAAVCMNGMFDYNYFIQYSVVYRYVDVSDKTIKYGIFGHLWGRKVYEHRDRGS